MWIPAAALAALLCALPAAQAVVEPSRLIAVFVVDGLRPDSINPVDTPTLARLRAEGAEYVNSHSIFPTVTRLNAATLATGAYPSQHGIVGNSMFVAGVNAGSPFDTGDYRQLLRLEEIDGRAALAQTLGEILQRNGRKLVTLSSGTTGNGFLLNPQARHGAGAAIHGQFDRGTTAAFPRTVSDAVIKRFGSPPAEPDNVGQMQWTDAVLRDYVLPELRPDVVIDWMGPLDAAQHANGVSAPQAKEALRRIDESLSRTIAKMQSNSALPLDVIITSDHGFAQHTTGVNVSRALGDAGLGDAIASARIVVASQSQSVLFYVRDREPDLTQRLVRVLQRQPWVDVIFTRGGSAGHGSVPGTFSLDLVKGSHASRGADVAISLAWTSNPNPYGVKGTQTINSSTIGRLEGAASGHGGLSPWVVRNTLIVWGPDFKARTRIDAPASLADLTPTMLAVLGIDHGCAAGCGRALREALKNGPGSVKTSKRVLRASADGYRASVQISTAAGHEYVDTGTRER